ncbi:MAG TPA: class I SAM-dependent methyltransferase [Candidatus Acidoferrum sp.]|nr:class I SAM-dependent methyltransferase [Candidatus Acidoferrum sp.]
MQQDKVKIKLTGVSETLLFCLWGRAQLSKKYSSLFYDAKAVELAEKIDYDFSNSEVPFEGIWLNISLKGNLPPFGLPALRAKKFDEKIKAYIKEHPRASVVNIGAGLDTTFYRVDNGTIQWYDLDLPAVIEIRRQLLPEPDRTTYIAESLFDPSWCKDIIYTDGGVFMVVGGVLPFFEASEVKQFFSMLADNFPGGEIIFDAPSKMNDDFREWGDQFPPEQRAAMRAAWMEALKDWWMKAPQDQKDKLINMIVALETPTKPKGKEWADLEAWWNQLSAKEMAEIWRSFRVSSNRFFGKWTLEDACEITKWDSRITVIDQSPLFKDVPRDPSLSAEIRQFMDYSDKSGRLNIFQLRV